MIKPLRILLVEDSTDDANLIIHTLEQGGYELVYERVETAQGMLKALNGQLWDIIISDYTLPGFNALRALALLKQLNLDIPFIVVSGSVREDMIVVAMKNGVHDYIMKDNLTRLVPAVARELREANVRHERRSVMDALRDRVRQQAAVAELSQTALKETNIQSLMDTSCEVVVKTLNVEFSKIMELLADGHVFIMRAGYGWKDGYIGRQTVGIGRESQSGYTLLSAEPVLVEDLALEMRFKPSPLLTSHGVVSGISVIIQGHAQPIGVLSAHSTKRRKFTKEDLNFLQAIANILSSAIERVRIENNLRLVNEELKKSRAILQEMAIRDELTGLYNRREIFRLLSEEIDRSNRYKRTLGLIMADLDHFKIVNDTYGHQVGDEVLRQISVILRKHIRLVDKVARYGGEEFIIVLPEVTRREAMETAERLCQFVESDPLVITQEKQEPINIHITISLGVANYPDNSDTLDSLVQAADLALYEAKKRGRNCVVQYDELQPERTSNEN